MISHIPVGMGSTPFVSTFFQESTEVEKQIDRTAALYTIAADALHKGINGVIPDPIVGDEACQIRALYFAMAMKDPSYKEDFKNTREVLGVKLSQILQIQKELKKNQAKNSRGLKQLKAEYKGLDKKVKCIVTLSKPKSCPLQEEEPTCFADSLMSIQQRFREIQMSLDVVLKYQIVKSKIAKIEHEDDIYLQNLKKKMPDETAISLSAMTYILSSILTTVKKKRTETNATDGVKIGHDDTVPAQIKQMAGSLVNDDLKQIVKAAQRALSKVSVDFIQVEAAKCVCSDSKILQEMVSKVKFVKHLSHGEHPEIPCFQATRVVFQRALVERIPIIFKVRNVKGDPYVLKDYSNISLFTVDTSGTQYTPAKWSSISSDTPAIVMECRSERAKEEIAKPTFVAEVMEKSGGIISLIEHLVAQHVQYTDQRRSNGSFATYFDEMEMPEEEKARVIKMGVHAIDMGLTPTNSFLCCPEHIYCSTSAKEMKEEASHDI